MYKQHIHQIYLILTFGCASLISAFGQYPTISLEEAIEISRKNHPGLEGGALLIEQQQKLAEAGLVKPPAQLYISGEEFDFKDQTGIHSVNIFQNFNLPKAAKANREFYQKTSLAAEKQFALTGRTLDWQVTQAYYQVLYSKAELKLEQEILELFINFRHVTNAQLEAGEIGIIPKLAARSKHGQAHLAFEHARERLQIARTLLSQLIRDGWVYDVEGTLPEPTAFSYDSISQANPHLQMKQAKIEVATAEVSKQHSQLLPQINSGFKLQTNGTDFPLFGYQLGINVPLFKKAYQGQIEAAQLGVKIRESELQSSKNELERTISQLRYQLQHQLHVIVYLQEQLAPIVSEQQEVNLSAYREGEIGYLEYLDSLEQVALVKKQLLEALYEFNVLKLELDYWEG